MHVIQAQNIRDALPQAFLYLLNYGKEESTRVGPAHVATGPIAIQYTNPKQHVLINPVRDANPFFHLMEAMWMLAGRDDAAYLNNYIRDFSSLYAKDGIVMDAYGHRWKYGYRYNQLEEIANQLSKDPTTRQAVLQMWGAGRDDLRAYSMKPCNLMATFRIVDGQLDMTVFNRSNDLIWGCCGANAVHFPLLQEYMAAKIRVPMGNYWQISTNLHLYHDHLKMLRDRLGDRSSIFNELMTNDNYENTMPLIEHIQQFDAELMDVMKMIDKIHNGESDVYETNITNTFLQDVVLPMALAHKMYRLKNMKKALHIINMVKADDWRRAGTEWLERRNG